MWKAAVAVTALACIVESACSPYVFSGPVQSFSTETGSIDSSYQGDAQKIVAEKRLINRIVWIRDKTVLTPGPGCTIKVHPTITEPCDLIPKTPKTAAVATATTVVKPTQPVAPAKDVCDAAADATPPPKTDTVKTLSPLQTAQLLKALDNYAAGLAAVTKAQDRADFDNAAAKVSAAIGQLAQSAPPPYSAAAPVAKASSNAALWLVGQDLDYRRLQQLQITTQAACEPMHVLAAALGVVLEDQRGDRLDGLKTLLVLKIEALAKARTTPHVTDQAYGAAIDDAQAAADAFQTVRATDPQAAAQALSNAHDELVVAVRNNDGQFAALITSLQTFAQRADDLAAAAAATGNPPAKKS